MNLFDRALLWLIALLASEESVSLPAPLDPRLRDTLRVSPYSGIIYFDARCPKCGGNARQHTRHTTPTRASWACVAGRLDMLR